MTARAKVFFILSMIILILGFGTNVVEARRRGRKFNDKSN